MSIGVGIVGGTGFGAGELLRILVNHPKADIISVISSSEAGQKISKFHPFLEGVLDIEFTAELNFNELLNYDSAVVFLALPDDVTVQTIRKIKNTSSKIKIIDLSGSHRLDNKELHEKFYPEAEYDLQVRQNFVYGLVELNKEKIKKANYIANPGCHVTACSLAVLPLADKINSLVVFDSKTGTSGGGRKLSDSFHHPRMNSSVSAYKVLSHRHEPEIRMALGNQSLKTFFVPHLLPISRGILATAYFEIDKKISKLELVQIYKDYYTAHPFVRIVENAEIRNVVGSNYCDISITVRENQVVVVSAIDNLVKGMAGVAIQNMNLISGIAENTGLTTLALGLV